MPQNFQYFRGEITHSQHPIFFLQREALETGQYSLNQEHEKSQYLSLCLRGLLSSTSVILYKYDKLSSKAHAVNHPLKPSTSNFPFWAVK
jgi:hypothetical protein